MTRKEAKKIADKLYPNIGLSSKARYTINDMRKFKREAYMKCWDDMQSSIKAGKEQSYNDGHFFGVHSDP